MHLNNSRNEYTTIKKMYAQFQTKQKKQSKRLENPPVFEFSHTSSLYHLIQQNVTKTFAKNTKNTSAWSKRELENGLSE